MADESEMVLLIHAAMHLVRSPMGLSARPCTGCGTSPRQPQTNTRPYSISILSPSECLGDACATCLRFRPLGNARSGGSPRDAKANAWPSTYASVRFPSSSGSPTAARKLGPMKVEEESPFDFKSCQAMDPPAA